MTLPGTGKRQEARLHLPQHSAEPQEALHQHFQRTSASQEALLPSLQRTVKSLEVTSSSATAPGSSGRRASSFSSTPQSSWSSPPAPSVSREAPGGDLQPHQSTGMLREERLQSLHDHLLGQKNRLQPLHDHLQELEAHLQELEATRRRVHRLSDFSVCRAHPRPRPRSDSVPVKTGAPCSEFGAPPLGGTGVCGGRHFTGYRMRRPHTGGVPAKGVRTCEAAKRILCAAQGTSDTTFHPHHATSLLGLR